MCAVDGVALRMLPENTGNECGELVLEERDIRISEMPGGKSFARNSLKPARKIIRNSLIRCVRGA
eukprot:5097616-Pyramimonas_sp.AAC.2